jgi:hypothetical protein
MTEYKILGIVEAHEIPDWERRPAKWADLIDQVLALEPGKTIMLSFGSKKAAERARTAVRDGANLKAQSVVVRTRLVMQDDTSAIVYLSRM